MKAETIIVSNRLPFQFDAKTEALQVASGGLVNAVRGVRFDGEATWIGSMPSTVDRGAWDRAVARLPKEDRLKPQPVFLDPELYDKYYNGLCNDVLWPMLHYEQHLARFDDAAWTAYRAVNQIFAEAVFELAPQGARVWIHDFHFFLLPEVLRKRRPDLLTGLFLHVPFPSSELFRQVPVRNELLNGMLHANLLGFHDYDYLRHFAAAARVILGLESSGIVVEREDGHQCRLGVFPVAIDTARYADGAAEASVVEAAAEFTERTHLEKVILGVDRLDYTKGIDLKLQAFRAMLERHPKLQGRVQLLQLAVPSRTGVPEYVRLRQEVEQLVGAINGRFGSPGYVPVNYMFTSLPLEELLMLYRVADVLLVTSKRDGMNLVAHEYIAAQDDADPGLVCLSEFAGSASVLPHAMRINPWDVTRTADQLRDALVMSKAERIRRHKPMAAQLRRYTATEWAMSFMDELDRAASAEEAVVRRPSARRAMQAADGRPVLLMLDFDGTLAAIVQDPPDARMTDELAETLKQLAAHPRCTICIVSGRDAAFLEAQTAGLDICLAAEHGGEFRGPLPAPWEVRVHSDRDSWYPVAARLMEDFSTRTPGTVVEHKRFGATWHYRLAPRLFAEYQSRRLVVELQSALANLPAQVLTGRKVIEVRAVEANKGQVMRWLMSQAELVPEDALVVAIGDDTTDEDMFTSAPDDAVTIKVGRGQTSARFRVPKQPDVHAFLSALLTELGPY